VIANSRSHLLAWMELSVVQFAAIVASFDDMKLCPVDAPFHVRTKPRVLVLAVLDGIKDRNYDESKFCTKGHVPPCTSNSDEQGAHALKGKKMFHELWHSTFPIDTSLKLCPGNVFFIVQP